MKRRADDVVSCCTEFGADSSTYSRFNDAAILTNSWSGKAIFCFDPNCKFMKIVLCFTKLCKACVQLTCIDQHLELLVSWSGDAPLGCKTEYAAPRLPGSTTLVGHANVFCVSL